MPQTCGVVSRADHGGLGISDAESVIAIRCYSWNETPPAASPSSRLPRGRRREQHSPRRPGERRDPNAEAVVVKDAVQRLSRNNPRRWLWVPACAGTTMYRVTLQRRPASLVLPGDLLDAGDQFDDGLVDRHLLAHHAVHRLGPDVLARVDVELGVPG